jgi:acetyl esterase/lipase
MYGIGLVLRATRRRRWTTAERARRRMAGRKREARPPRWLTRRHDVHERPVGGFPCWTVRPRRDAGAVALYLHGGAYVSGLAAQHWTLIGRLADEGVRVDVPLYPLAPQHTYRDAYPVVHEVYRQLVDDAPPGGLVLAGDSAGGGLALGLAQELTAHDVRRPDRVVLLSPWLDLTLSHPQLPEYERRDPWLARPGLIEAGLAWAGGDDPALPRLSPANGPLRGLPPVAVFVGTRELAYPDAVDFARGAAAEDVVVDLTVADGALHVYPLLPAPEGAEGARAVAAAVAGTTAAEAVSPP